MFSSYVRQAALALLFLMPLNLFADNVCERYKPQKLPDTPEGGEIGSLLFTSEGRVLAGTSAGIYISSDSGASWKPAQPPTFNDQTALGKVYSFIEVNGVIYASGNRNAMKGVNYNFNFLYSSKDGGLSWSDIGDDVLNSFIDPMTKGIFPARLSSFNHQLFLMNKTGLMTLSPDGWTQKNLTAFQDKDSGNVLAMTGCGQGLYVATTEHIYHSSNMGETWEVSQEKGLQNQLVTGFSCLEGNIVFAATEGGGFLLKGGQWYPVPSTEDNQLRIIGSDTQRVYVTNRRRAVFSYDGLGNLEYINGIADRSTPPLNQEPQTITEVHGKLLVGLNSGVYDPVDWQGQNSGLYAQRYTGIAGMADGTWLVSTESSGLFYTRNGGVNWTAVNENLHSLNIKTIARTAQDFQAFDAEGTSYVLSPQNFGVTGWTALPTPLKIKDQWKSHTGFNGSYFILSSEGIMKIFDKGKNVVIDADGLRKGAVPKNLYSSGQTLYAIATDGIYSRHQSSEPWQMFCDFKNRTFDFDQGISLEVVENGPDSLIQFTEMAPQVNPTSYYKGLPSQCSGPKFHHFDGMMFFQPGQIAYNPYNNCLFAFEPAGYNNVLYDTTLYNASAPDSGALKWKGVTDRSGTTWDSPRIVLMGFDYNRESDKWIGITGDRSSYDTQNLVLMMVPK